MFGQGSFVNSAATTPEEIARKRAEIAAMMPRFGNARYVGEGLGQLFMGIGLGRQQKALDGQEREGRASAQERFNAILGGGIQGRAQPGGFSVLGTMPMEPVSAPDPASPEGIASDAMAALGRATYTPGDRESFVKAMMPHALRVSQETGLDPRLVIAQAAQETGWGKAAPNNNYFGIKSHGRGGGGTFATTEFVNGQPITINDSFRGYGSMGESAADYARFLQENPRYRDMLAAPDLESQIAALGASGYATDPNYANSVASIANSIQIPGMDAAPVGGMNSPQMTAATIPTEELIALASNGYLNPEQRAMAQAMLDQQMKMNDPAYTMGLRADELAIQKAQMEIDQMRNPQPEFTQLSAQEVAALGLPPGVYQRGPDGRIDTIEKTQAPADPIAELRARATAAGLQEGTPEFQAFMLSGGKQQDGMVIESDGQGGFRMVQGAGASGAAAKPFTEGQSKDVVYATRAKGALEALDPIANALTSRGDVAAGYIPFGLGGGLQDDQYQVAKTAGDEFLQAILRKDTGAAITPDEQALYGETYLPQPGDNEARLAYKAAARQRAVAAIEAGMSPAQIIAQERALAEDGTAPQPQTTTQPAAAPQGGPSVADIGKMTMQDLLRIDVNALSDEQMDAMMKRFDEVNK